MSQVSSAADDERGGEQPAPRAPDRGRERDARTGQASAALRVQQQARWVELQLQRAMERGDFDDLPGHGKPLRDLGREHDPDWWLRRLVEREQLTVLPPALQLRKDDAELDAHLDRITTEREVRSELDDFNRRVRHARMQLQGGPPVITPLRDVEAEVAAWSARRDGRRAARAEALRARREADEADGADGAARRTRPWWRRHRRC